MEYIRNISGVAKALCLGYAQGIILMMLGILAFSSVTAFCLHAVLGSCSTLDLVEVAGIALVLTCHFCWLLWRWAFRPDDRMSGK